MKGQLTAAGVAALQANSAVKVPTFKLGTAFGYVPQSGDNVLHGTTVWTGSTTGPVAANANVVMWGAYLGIDVGPLQFGELGLYLEDGTTLFALFASDVLIQKIQQNSVSGTPNEFTFQIFVSMVGSNYDIWLDIGQTDNQLTVPRVLSVDQLPAPQNATPNIYVVPGATAQQQAVLAVTDRTSLWSYNGYDFANTSSYSVGAAVAPLTVQVSAQTLKELTPAYFGELIVQFTSGPNYGISRYVESAVANGDGTYTLAFLTPMAVLPRSGDTFNIYRRDALTLSNAVLPIAGEGSAGAVKPGNKLSVESDGTLDVDQAGLVTVNGKASDASGNVTLTGADVQTTWSQVQNKPGTFAPPIASSTVLGGVKIPAVGSIFVDASGNLTLDPNIANGAAGISSLVGLIRPTLLSNATDMNTLLTAGLYYGNNGASMTNGPGFPADTITVEVVPFSTGSAQGKVMQRWSQQGYTAYRVCDGTTNGAWTIIAAPALAAAGTPGLATAGAGLNVNNGVLSSKLLTVNNQLPDANGNIVVSVTSAGGFDASAVGQQGGIGGWLSSDPSAPTPPPQGATGTQIQAYMIAKAISDYKAKRLPENELPPGTLHYMGQWNASNNTASGSFWNGSTKANETRSFTLAANGLINITYVGTGLTAPDNTVIPDIAIQVDAAGMAFTVGTAGATALDGNTSFDVGDMVFSMAGRWWKKAQSLGLLNNKQVSVLSGFTNATAAQGTALVQASQNVFYGNQGAPTGTITATGFSFVNDTTSGLFGWAPSGNPVQSLAMAVGGTARVTATSTGASVNGAFSVSGTSTFTGAVTMSAGANVTGNVTASGTVQGATVASTGNVTAAGSVNATGNVSSAAQLGGATLNVSGAGAVGTLTVNGVASIQGLLTLLAGATVTGNVTASGQVQGATLVVTGTSDLKGAVTMEAGATVTGGVTASGTVQGAAVTATGALSGATVTTTGNAQVGGNVNTPNNVTAGGTVQGAAVSSTGNVSAAGSVTGQTGLYTGNGVVNFGNGWTIVATAGGLYFELNGVVMGMFDTSGNFSSHGNEAAYNV